MGKIHDLTGQKFEMLTVKKLIGRKNDKTWWECECECGNTIQTTARTLLTGRRTSCGCKRYAKRIHDLTGKRFGRLVVIELSDYKPNKSYRDGVWWKCKCDCGNETIKSSHRLVEGSVKSCGCLANKGGFVKHGMTRTVIYNRWNGMRKRCRYNKNYKDVTVCPEWDDFTNFYNWAMQNGFDEKLTLDRIDPYGNYEPSNCRWVDMKVQGNNKRNNTYFTIDGIRHTLQEWSEIKGIDVKTILYRLKTGMNPKDAVMSPAKNQPQKVMWIETGMIFDSINACARAVGINSALICCCVKGKQESTHGYHFKRV